MLQQPRWCIASFDQDHERPIIARDHRARPPRIAYPAPRHTRTYHLSGRWGSACNRVDTDACRLRAKWILIYNYFLCLGFPFRALRARDVWDRRCRSSSRASTRSAFIAFPAIIAFNTARQQRENRPLSSNSIRRYPELPRSLCRRFCPRDRGRSAYCATFRNGFRFPSPPPPTPLENVIEI